MRKGERTRKRIVVQTADLLNTQGYRGTPVSEIMRVSGLQKGGIYRHFESRDALTLEAFEFAVARVRNRFLQAIAGRETAKADPTPVPSAAAVIAGARDVTLRTADGLELGAWFVPADPSEDIGMAVLLAPGNAGNRAGRAELAEELSRRGLAVLVMDYRGYGGNPGSPTEDGLAADADAAADALGELGYATHRTIYFGESLGAAVVTALQARRPPAAMVLRSPFTDLADVGRHHYPWLPVRALIRDRFPVVDHLEASDVPVTVIYGLRDSVVPSGLSARVADQAPALAERVVLAGADHNDPVMFGSRVADAVKRLARGVV